MHYKKLQGRQIHKIYPSTIRRAIRLLQFVKELQTGPGPRAVCCWPLVCNFYFLSDCCVYEVAGFLVNVLLKPLSLSSVCWVAVFSNEDVFQSMQQTSDVWELNTVQCTVIILNNSKYIICLQFVVFLTPTFKSFGTWWNDKLILWRDNMLTMVIDRQPLLMLLLLTLVGHA